ncbi:hypothetical protein AB4Z48_37810 [Cupriavidus sp. 2TAF22]|uniref:hypothetical protein n=1 Tax=unclassified Cupriavidus TaxID=2640874 RepID=UPI003F9232FE
MHPRNIAGVAVSALMLGSGFALADEHHASTYQLGKITFPTSCDPKVQPLFERGVAMLHSFWFTEAGKTFNAVVEQDSNCAIAYWGLAVNLLGNSLAGPPSLRDAQAASEAVAKARAIGAKTQRERDWIDAIGAYYRDYDRVSVDTRLQAYADAMQRMTQRYPDDDEVWIYYALALQAAAPVSDRTYANQRKSAEILEKLFAKNPQHPGAAHYLIHAYDYPPLAAKGLAAASKYASIAPAAPHARHMPSHIYTMLGLWEESIKSNQAALEVQPDYYHALDFMVYAHLQLSQDVKARALIEQGLADAMRKPPVLKGNKNSVAAMPARYALERADWKAAAALPITSNNWAYADSITRFARGLGMARSGGLTSAKQEIDALKTLREELGKSNESYWVARTDEEIAAVAAWTAQAEGNPTQAERLMRAAADGEDASIKNVAMENRLFPMRELLADLLAVQGRAGEALREYEAALREYPNRYHGLYGAAHAADASGQRDKAVEYYKRLLVLTKNADSARPETAAAKAYLAAH